MMKIKVTAQEYKAAKSYGCAYGKYLHVRPIKYVRVDLGPEREYEPLDWEDDEKRRIFFRCQVNFASTEEAVDAEEFDYYIEDQTVTIYC